MLCYLGFEHFARSIFAQPTDALIVFTLYCDDSGTHAQSPVAVAACFVSTVDQWKHFCNDWQSANDTENFGVFHMADFVGKKKQFADEEWLDEEKRERTIKRLVNIIVTRRRHAFIAAVNKADYDAEVPQDVRQRFRLGNNHYTFAVRMCLGQIIHWRERYGYHEPVQFVFDRMSKGMGEISAAFEQALGEDEDRALRGIGLYASGWSFQSKSTVLPLQAADILAWETFNYMQKSFLPEKKEPMRRSYKALTDVATTPKYNSRDSLRRSVWRFPQSVESIPLCPVSLRATTSCPPSNL